MNNSIYRIETDRCVLRPLKPSDALELKNLVESNLDHLKPWMPWAKEEPLEKKAEQIRSWRGNFDLNTDYHYAVFYPDNRRMIGSSGLHPRLGENARGECKLYDIMGNPYFIG